MRHCCGSLGCLLNSHSFSLLQEAVGAATSVGAAGLVPLLQLGLNLIVMMASFGL
jgi:hypothetical protein